mgnify:CR=1 FL=1
MNKIFFIFSLLYSLILFSQNGIEKDPPFNIKTISFTVNNNNVIPFFKLGESFELRFDDLYGDEADYYYTITQYNYDWSGLSDLAKVEFLNGMDNQRIITYENSFNTLQLYSHYKQVFPNRFNQITKSGNYMITVLNDEGEIVFSRRFIIYEEQVSIGLLVRRARDFDSLDGKQNIEMTINYGDRVLQNPIQNVKVTIFQNGNWKNSISNIKPQYTLGSELIYRYNKETQFWAGNETYSIDNNNTCSINIPNTNISICIQSRWKKTHVDYIHQFIKCIGIYPVGTLVKLKSQKLGIVTCSNFQNPLQPWVKVFYSAKHQHHTEVKDLNLADKYASDELESAIKPEEFGIDLMRFFKNSILS